jgi:hypothetical protein
MQRMKDSLLASSKGSRAGDVNSDVNLSGLRLVARKAAFRMAATNRN